MKTFTAYIEWDPETKLYVGIVPGFPGAHTQAATLDELRQNLREVLELCLEGQARPLIREILREIKLAPQQFREELEKL